MRPPSVATRPGKTDATRTAAKTASPDHHVRTCSTSEPANDLGTSSRTAPRHHTTASDPDDWATELLARETGLCGGKKAIEEELLWQAYRFHLPCITAHDATTSVNCEPCPSCLVGLQTLPTTRTAREGCVRAIMGTGPLLVQSAPFRTDDNAEAALHAPLWRGVGNLGNTCYLNSVLQLLCAMAPLRRVVLADGEVVENAHPSPDPPRIPTHDVSAPLAEDSLAASKLKEVWTEMTWSWSGDGADAADFARYLSLDVTAQQDAQEFLLLLLDWLRGRGGTVQRAIDATLSWTLLFDRRCGCCGRSAKKAESLYTLSLPLRPTLHESIDEFLRPEEVEGFTCEACGQTATATSRQYLRSLPEVLLIHLNHFVFDVHTLQRRKRTDSVRFPRVLDMTPYVEQWHRAKSHTKDAEAAIHTDPRAMGGQSRMHRYELRGIVNHHGDSAQSGHYTFDAKVPRSSTSTTWLRFNDADTSELPRQSDEDEVSSKEAYILFYQRLRPDATSTLATDAPTWDEFAPRLTRAVTAHNAQLQRRREEWSRRGDALRRVLTAWATAADAVFTAAPSFNTECRSQGKSENTSALGYVLPTTWLSAFGRCFLPPYVSVHSLTAPSVTGEAEDAPRANTETHPSADVTVVTQAVQRYAVLRPSAALWCPHGALAPWAAYKRVPASAVPALRAFFATCVDESERADQNAIPAALLPLRASGLCVRCAHAMASAVRELASDGARDAAIAAALTHTTRSNTTTAQETLVYVDDAVARAWEAYVTCCTPPHTIGYTGLYAQSRMHDAATPSSVQKALDAVWATEARLTCPHGNVCVEAVVRIVPESVRQDWAARLTTLWRCRHPQNNDDNDVAEVTRRWLPYVVVGEGVRCEQCIAHRVSATVERHRERLQRLEVARRLPTLWLAARMTSSAALTALRAELDLEHDDSLVLSRHPNVAFFRRPVRETYKTELRRWRDAQDAEAGRLEKYVTHLAHLAARERAVALPMTPTTRRGRRDKPAHSSESTTTTWPESSATGRYHRAQADLHRLRTAPAPAFEHVFVCVPTPWLARWYGHMLRDDAAPDVPLDYDTFLCPHGGCRVELAWLNPSDGFWQGARLRRPELVWTAETEDGSMAWWPPLTVVPMAEGVEVVRRYGAADLLRMCTNETTDESAPELNRERVICAVERHGERGLTPPSCATCCAQLQHDFEQRCARFVHGTLHLQLHLRRSKKQFYDATSTLRSLGSEWGDLHHGTTLEQLRHGIVEHIARQHGLRVPVAALQLMRGRNRPLRYRPTSTETGDRSASGDVVPDTATLHELDLHDGDTLWVHVTDAVATPCEMAAPSASRTHNGDDAVGEELWEDVPPELLQPHAAKLERDATFAETRLQGRHVRGESHTVHENAATTHGVSCPACTYLNAPGMVQCEMCETPLPRR